MLWSGIEPEKITPFNMYKFLPKYKKHRRFHIMIEIKDFFTCYVLSIALKKNKEYKKVLLAPIVGLPVDVKIAIFFYFFYVLFPCFSFYNC